MISFYNNWYRSILFQIDYSTLALGQQGSLEKYDYSSLGILGEPYFDIDFNKFFYLTDTGRRWDGWRVSVRDKIPQQDEWVKKGWVFHSTDDIINAAKENRLPDKIMMTFHPQRWSDSFVPWVKELVFQNVKNIGKRMIVRMQEE
jgi:hypothetical protein